MLGSVIAEPRTKFSGCVSQLWISQIAHPLKDFFVIFFLNESDWAKVVAYSYVDNEKI